MLSGGPERNFSGSVNGNVLVSHSEDGVCVKFVLACNQKTFDVNVPAPFKVDREGP